MKRLNIKRLKLQNTLRARLSLSYVLITLVCVIIISIMINGIMEKQFGLYMVKNQEHKNTELVGLIGKLYNDGIWNNASIENIGVNAIEQGMIVKVSNNSGKVIWDASTHNNGMCKKMLDDMAKNMNKYYHNWDGKYLVKTYPIIKNNTKIGSLNIGYYGPFYYNYNDFTFVSTINKLIIVVGVFSLVFALILGGFMAKWLSNPISRVVKTTENIARGYYNTRVNEKSNTKEIKQLTTAINNLAETLELQEALRKRMSSDVAHELRTPLAILQSYIEAIIDGIWKPNKERLESCHEEIMRIIRLVSKLEDIDKCERESHKLNKVKFNITEHVWKIICNFETEFKSKNVKVNFSRGEEDIIADKDKLSQVFINLISNALKYTPEYGEVELNVVGTLNTIEIRIKDTGIGISPEDLPFVFERFYRADKSRNRLTGGFGIGLTIVKTILDSHKGKITVKSRLNEGTEFVIILPKE